MIKPYLPYEPDQQLLLPAALQEWLPDDHLAYFISDVVDQLDMSKVTARYERERRGGPPYHPRMMVKVLLYGYCVGVASSRRIAQRLHEDIAFRVLAANNTPDFRTISDFRKDNVDALSGLFVQVLALCQQAGLVKLGHVALDDTKVKANASKHKAMSYQRMKEKATSPSWAPVPDMTPGPSKGQVGSSVCSRTPQYTSHSTPNQCAPPVRSQARRVKRDGLGTRHPHRLQVRGFVEGQPFPQVGVDLHRVGEQHRAPAARLRPSVSGLEGAGGAGSAVQGLS